MTQFLTRREMREAERSGRPIDLAASSQEPEAQGPDLPALDQQQASEQNPAAPTAFEATVSAAAQAPGQALPAVAGQPLLSRREMRLAEANGYAVPDRQAVDSNEAVLEEEVSISEPIPVLVPEVILAAIEEVTAETAQPEIRSTIDLSVSDFTGSNLLAEPSTQSIVLDIAPEAISLPLDTMDGVSTGSISILPDTSTGALTGALDGLVADSADRVDTVTGIITMVDPVSALDVINQRVTMAVVPDDALRKNWWQAWAYGALGVGLAAATIIATIAIISAVGE